VEGGAGGVNLCPELEFLKSLWAGARNRVGIGLSFHRIDFWAKQKFKITGSVDLVKGVTVHTVQSTL
jgi:hypothetical protein